MSKKLTTLKVKRLFLGRDSGNRVTEITATPTEINALSDITSSTSELNLLDGSVEANTGTNVAVLLDSAGAIQTGGNIGTPNTGVSATEYGDGINHITRLAVTTLAMPNASGASALELGVLLYTFPATGDIIIKNATYNAYMTIDGAGNAAKTPEFALGSTIGTAASATTDGAATDEDIMTGTAGAADGSTATALSLVQSVVLAKGANTLNFNAADTWAAASTATSVTGIFFVEWSIRVI